ncbi:MAG: hypothetical protein QW292_11970 [Candidatus Parvarchaeota archaeon]
MGISRMLALLNILRSTFYYDNKSDVTRGKRRSASTGLINDSVTTIVSEDLLACQIIDILSREFVCYGYKKVTACLKRFGHEINKKHVFPIIEENNILNHAYSCRSQVRKVVESRVIVTTTNIVWEMNIK